MSTRVYFGVLLAFGGMMFAVCAVAQSGSDVSLGDLARSLRQSKVSKTTPAAPPKEPAASTIIDNDNLTQVIEQVEKFRLNGKPMLSFDGGGKNFQMTSPDGTCSLSFNANATALLATPFVAENLPPAELAKLDGPASIRDDTLEVSVYNASSWDVKEITVGLTIVRRAEPPLAADNGIAKLLPAVAQDEGTADSVPPEKHSDMTVLLHLKGSATPLATTIFRQKLEADLSPDQEWHWAIVDAKGIPAAPTQSMLQTP
jgi:hypothetical protein